MKTLIKYNLKKRKKNVFFFLEKYSLEFNIVYKTNIETIFFSYFKILKRFYVFFFYLN